MAPTTEIDRNRPSPVYHQISSRLRERIVNGELPAGTRLPNGQELSRQYGVAYRTIIKSLEILKKEGLLVGVPSRGTFVRAQQARTVRNIAVTVDQMYHQAVASHLEVFQRTVNSACVDSGFHLQLFSLPEARVFGIENQTLLSTLLRDRHIDGLITYHGPPPEDIARLARMNVPVVTSRDVYPNAGVPWVMEDVADGARKLVRFLVGGLGHRRIKLLMARKADPTSQIIRPSALLAKALAEELRAQDIPFDDERDAVYSEFFWDKAAPTVRNWLSADKDRVTAIIACDDDLAQQAASLAQELGLGIPRNLSIASYTYGDVIPQSTLTAIHVPIREIAQKCVEIIEQIMGGQTPSSAEPQVQLAIRQTCGPANV